MTQRRTPAALAAINSHQIIFAFVASIVWLASDACALPAINTLLGLPTYNSHPQVDMQQALLNELLDNVNEDAFFSELKKYQHQQPTYLSKWAGLRDILPTFDYGEEHADSGDTDDSYETSNTRLVDHLQQLATNSVDGIGVGDVRADNPAVIQPVMPFRKKPQSGPVAFKDHGIKKNIQLHKQYMSPCHFKICNMGRKRNARYLDD
uniref:Uncharacterized protein n=1 Tax=Ceratitis capitata TaxID=7213 RepID=W8B4L4_CERCA